MQATTPTVLNDIQGHFDNYITWLKDKTCLREIRDGWVEITTPHLDRHNDCLQMYVRIDGDDIFFTDGGYIINDLEASGVSLTSPKRDKILREILNGFGVTLDKYELKIMASADNFAVRKNNLLQAMLAVDDMFALAQSTVSSLFYEDVEEWLDVNEVRYLASPSFKGKSGFDFTYDFVIPKSRTSPERYLKAINMPNKSNIEHLLFSWSDTKVIRPDGSTLYAVLNDRDSNVSNTIKQSLNNYGVVSIPWTERSEHIDKLVA